MWNSCPCGEAAFFSACLTAEKRAFSAGSASNTSCTGVWTGSAFFKILQVEALSIGVGIVSAKVIDEINILEASRKAMYIALNNLDITPEYILSDAVSLNDIDIPSRPIIHGDALSLSIAAASVIAKVTRDHIMYELDKKYPMYNYKKNKGYPTKEHLELIKKYGITDEYRISFKPVKMIWEGLHEEENKKVVEQ